METVSVVWKNVYNYYLYLKSLLVQLYCKTVGYSFHSTVKKGGKHYLIVF